MAKPTLKAIAEACDVSVSTVSRVFSGSAPISKATQERIYRSAKEIGFDIAAYRNHKERAAVAFLVYLERSSGFENPFYLESIHGAYDACFEEGYDLVVHFSDKNEAELLEKLIGRRSVRGGILSTVQTDEHNLHALKEKGFPFSVIGRPANSEGLIWVDNDNYNASYTIAAELLNRGYERIAYVGKDLSYQFATDRYEGFRQSFGVRGRKLDETLVYLNHPDEEFQQGLRAFIQQTEPDAILADDDESALIAAGLCAELDLKLKIVGFNYMPFPRMGLIDLELIDIRPRELGYWAAKLLLARLEGRDAPANRMIPAGGLRSQA